tara:strand:- start:7544 stop:8071 length:528 start_codon:yes stop_codon:yes gene_type:complete
MKNQTKSINNSGSFVNWMMSNNNTLPEIGEGATELMWSDRQPHQVTWVSDDKSECIIQSINAKRIDTNGMSESQNYDYSDVTDHKQHLIWRNKQGGCWCIKSKEIRFIPKFKKQYEIENQKEFYASELSKELKTEIFGDKYYPQNIIKGITKEYTNYNKINIAFGYAQKYHDFTF